MNNSNALNDNNLQEVSGGALVNTDPRFHKDQIVYYISGYYGDDRDKVRILDIYNDGGFLTNNFRYLIEFVDHGEPNKIVSQDLLIDSN